MMNDPVKDYVQSINWNPLVEDDGNFLDDSYVLSSACDPPSIFMSSSESDDEVKTNKRPTDYSEDTLQLPASKKIKKIDDQRVSEYIPGFNTHTDFPRLSELNVQEQAAFLDLSKRLTPDRLPFLDRREQTELQLYMELNRRIQIEQKYFVAFAHKKNLLRPIEYGMMHDKTKQYIEAALKQRQLSVPYKYPPLYHYLSYIPLSHPSENHPVQMTAIKELLSLGSVAHFEAPKFDRKTILPTKSGLVEQHFPASGVLSPRLLQEVPPGEKLLYNVPVSEDGNAVALALQHDADIVVSSSVLQLLIDCHPNHPQNCATPRDIPVTVKMMPTRNGGQKRVVFLDKALPPLTMTMHDKKTWYCKRAIRAFFCKSGKRIFDFTSSQEVVSPMNLEPKQEPKSTVSDTATESSKLEESQASEKKMSFDEELRMFKQQQQQRKKKGVDNEEGLKIPAPSMDNSAPTNNFMKISKEFSEWTQEKGESKKDGDTNQGGADKVGGDKPGFKAAPCLSRLSPRPDLPGQPPELACRPAPNHNVVYGLWSLHQKVANKLADSDWERAFAELKMVVRTSYHGYEWDKETGCAVLLHTSLKLEHQPQYGAQMTTVGETAREWMAMHLRPNSALYRVRVNAFTNEVIQLQRLGIRDLVCEARQRSLNLEHCLGALHHVLGLLARAEPAKYLLKLCQSEGVAQLIQQDCSGKNRSGSFFNLHLAYSKASSEESPFSRVSYSTIDTNLQTPYQKYCKRVPATFEPKNFRPTKKKSKKNKGKNRRLKQQAFESQQAERQTLLELAQALKNRDKEPMREPEASEDDFAKTSLHIDEPNSTVED